MIKIDHKKAQAATELAVFGAILIFLLGTIVRSAVSNSYTQNENLKIMRMAMLASWNDSKAGLTAHNSASQLFVEDRLSPDFSKYGDLDRNPYIANGSGSFTFQLLYPLTPGQDNMLDNMPIMDVNINGQHFPFTTANYVTQQITPSMFGVCAGGPYENPPITPSECRENQCLRNQREWVPDPSNPAIKYKLFYTIEANALGTNGTSQFSVDPPICANLDTIACKDKALSSTLQLKDSINGLMFTNDGAMQYDLLRNGDYSAVDLQFPPAGAASNMRSYIAWQWAATVASDDQGNTSDGADPMIGLDPDNNEYPTYDIDGRLKEVTIYAISVDQITGYPTVGYEDYQGGDIDATWDSNSCTPKPGLQNDSEIFTFTKDGTYLQIKEGQVYNPETGQVVRSVNQRDKVDLIQRSIQLSNNTGRFCPQNYSGSGPPPNANVGGTNDPNPVEICVDGKTDNCFNGSNIAKTCYDTSNNMIYVRSRLEDRRGYDWITNASGQLDVTK